MKPCDPHFVPEGKHFCTRCAMHVDMIKDEAYEKRIAELEKVAETAINALAPNGIPDHELSLAVRVIRKPIMKALRAAGYLGVGNE